ncbi:peptidoglycan-binding domain-containing protein [Pararhizobium haloflavum]|uniref:peptidoglycan-binding domain-containing protein n=1 Tax=Pararhizobium haloflavum TaxID=2037914 RepID=UPI0018E46C2B|nr:peptidoglycan-binding domain-containing protein [Pararhizobium haloflavum]
MTRKQKQPEKRRRSAKTKPGIVSIAARAAGRTVSRHPSLAAGGAAFAVVFTFVAANAIWYQPGGHPSPLLMTRTDFTPRPSVIPDVKIAAPTQAEPVTPRASLQDQPARDFADATPEGTGDEPQTIEDILTPVPARRVQSVSIRQDDDTQTASIPDRHDTDQARSRAPVPNDNALLSAMQRELKRLGFYDGEIDGLSGPKTAAALADYAERTGLDQAPQPSETLLARMKLARIDEVATPLRRPSAPVTETQPRPRAPESAASSLQVNYIPPASIPNGQAPDDMVTRIQQGLVNIAYSDVAVDGMMGSQTREAIRHFQSHYRLPETGEPSAAVLEKLQEIGAF